MYDNPAITWALTAVLLLGGSYNLLRAIRSHLRRDQVNNTLNALMNAVMAAMLWNVQPFTVLGQILVLAGAALWFLVQAVARPRLGLCTSSKGRIRCLYHSLTMVGAALMVAFMGHATGLDPGIVPSAATSAYMPMRHHDHIMTTPTPGAGAPDYTSELALLLTILFGAAAVVFSILLLRLHTASKALHLQPQQLLSVSAEHALEALGAAVMALMFATMSG
ncbi:DUF5134 domain-containing protein [Sinomonas flava]|uniref:DUF5134 domain-containing protein n=1 Tax=Sinomonas flava TaxID=496857 RepID=UPI0039A45594